MESFNAQLEKAADFFNSFDGTLRLISHHDTDGICAAGIMISALNRKRRKYSISVVPQLDEPFLSDLAQESYSGYIFTDLGSGQLNLIRKYMASKKVLILDHHKPERANLPSNILHVNPHSFGINGSRDIAGAGVVYMFTLQLDRKNEPLANLAVIGAIGDCQEHEGFTGLNAEILKTAQEKRVISVSRGLCLFGAQSKPLHKLLEQCFDPYIPGVSGSSTGTLQMLKDLGIRLRVGNSWKMLSHLTDEEKDSLANEIADRRGEDVSSLIGNIYTLPKEEGAYRDAREFSTILNSCGRMGKASLGIGVCLGDSQMKDRAVRNLSDYKREIVEALQWYNSGSKDIIRKKGYIIINSRYNVLPSIAGTLASIISRDEKVAGGTLILSMARTDKDKTKVSLRIAGNLKYSRYVDLREVLDGIAAKVAGQSGGHRNAAGAIIDSAKEQEFIEIAKANFSRIAMEEQII